MSDTKIRYAVGLYEKSENSFLAYGVGEKAGLALADVRTRAPYILSGRDRISCVPVTEDWYADADRVLHRFPVFWVRLPPFHMRGEVHEIELRAEA